MRLLIINNIEAGYGEASVYDFIRSFSKADDEIIVRNIVKKSLVKNLLKDANKFDAIVAAGDDDIVAKVSYELSSTNIPILPYPSGQWNLIAQNLYLPTEAHSLAELLRDFKTLKFDIGELTINNKKIGFGCNAGIGYSTKIGKDAMATRKLFGPFAYIGAALNNFKPQFSDFKIELDEKTINTAGIGVLILNFSKIGLDLSVTHQNRPRDGKFDIVILKAKTAIRYVPALTAATLDKAIEFPDRSDAIEIHRSAHVKIEANPKMEIQIDGISIEQSTPLEANVLKQAVNYIVDQDCYNNYLSQEKSE